MEMLELNNANQAINANGDYNLIGNQQQQQLGGQPQISTGQVDSAQAQLYRNHHQQQHQQQAMMYRTKKPRELPVDVPESFVAVAKQSPRYPPPKPHRQLSPSMQISNLTTFNNAQTNLSYNSNNPASCPQSKQPAAPLMAQSNAASIATHNSSLRSSIKLKQLEKSRADHGQYPIGHMQPAINQAFELNEDDSTPAKISQHQVHHNQQQQALKLKQSMPDLCSIYNRLQRNLHNDFAEVSGDAKFEKLLSIYNTIVQTHNKQVRLPDLTSRYQKRVTSHGVQEPLVLKVSDLLQTVIKLLRGGEEMTRDAYELLSLLCKHEVDGVCSAFDRISQSFEFAKSMPTTSTPTTDIVTDDSINHQPLDNHHNMVCHQQNAGMYQYRQAGQYDYVPDQIQMDIENNLYQNSLQPLTDIDLNETACTKTVEIKKNSNQALGATIKNEDGGSVIIGRIICGGAAYKSGLLNEGDELLDVNGIELRGRSVNEVIEILNDMDDTLIFTIVSRSYKPIQRPVHEKIFVKTFFRYDGQNDRYSPCKELGLSFERGEILEIIDQGDPKWWQARREGENDDCHLAGLIPSIDFLKEREKENDNEGFTNTYLKREKKNLVSKLFNCPKGSSPRRRKKFAGIPPALQEIPYYEEVTLHYPSQYCRRPIILAGPKRIGQGDIMSALLADENRFSSTPAYTSRPKGPGETNGDKFYFVSRAQFENDMSNGKFIEFGQYQNHYYGTSLEDVKKVVKSRKTCILIFNTSTIFKFRQSRAVIDLKPFFVFVKPDDSYPEKLRNLVERYHEPKSNLDETIKSIRSEVELVEAHYLPYFDLVLTVSDIDRASKQLLEAIDKIEGEPSWIPMFWRDGQAT